MSEGPDRKASEDAGKEAREERHSPERSRDDSSEHGAASSASSASSASPATPGPDKPHGDLIVEHWQAPKLDKMKADAREIWEFESEKVRPSGALWLNLVGIILVLAGGLALIAYGIYWLVSAADAGGP